MFEIKIWLEYKSKIDDAVWKYIENNLNITLVQDYYISYYSDQGIFLSSISGKNTAILLEWDLIKKEINNDKK